MEPKKKNPNEFPIIRMSWSQDSNEFIGEDEYKALMVAAILAIENAVLEDIDNSVQGEGDQESFGWIMNAYRKIEDETRL